MNACSETLAPGIGAYSEISDAGRLCDLAGFSDLIAEACRLGAGDIGAHALRDLDIKVLCAVFCCCKANPNPGAGGNLYDSCASETVARADALSGHRSRFKSQVSYNMRADPPVPLMEKGLLGGLTTTPLPVPEEIGHMKNRIEKESPGVEPYGGLDMRRPDVVIVKDPTHPPTTENIAHIADFKFNDDPWGRGQRESYERINNGLPVIEISERRHCDCDDGQQQEQTVTALEASRAYQEEQRSALERTGWAALGVVGAAATAIAVLSPFEGPVGDAVAGTATAAAWGRALGSAATAALRSTVTARAAQTMRTLFSGAAATP